MCIYTVIIEIEIKRVFKRVKLDLKILRILEQRAT